MGDALLPAALPFLKLPPSDSTDEAFDRYMTSVSDYLKRQLLVYQNWPQRKFGALGYLNEKVFPDMNA